MPLETIEDSTTNAREFSSETPEKIVNDTVSMQEKTDQGSELEDRTGDLAD